MSNIDPRNPPWNPYEKVCFFYIKFTPLCHGHGSLCPPSTKTQKLITFFEQLELLTEILKAANVAPEALIPIVRSLNHPPQWNDVALPRGESMRAFFTRVKSIEQF